MKIIFTWKELIIVNGTVEIIRFPADCNVRQELNKRRKKNEVVYTVPKFGHRKPYYPRQFPSGIFAITGVEYTDDLEYAPVKIKTTATRDVFLWELNKDGDYWIPTEEKQIDTAYWLHHTKSSTTLGCIKIGSEENALALAHIVESTIEAGESVLLEVL